MMIARNDDAPGVLGLIGTVLGDHEINIAAMFNARETIGGEALTVYSLDQAVSPSIREQLLDDERVNEIRYIQLNGA
jgi:D-3-phosphoglycerate dehydrogenase